MFYVYILRRPDKEDPFEPGRSCPFYVGKGSNGRIKVHRKEAQAELHKLGWKKHKNNVILSLWKANLDYEEDIVLTGCTEEEAFFYESQIILAYGRIDLGTGCLSNLTNGGEGIKGQIRSEETKRKISEFQKGKTLSKETRHKISEANKGTKHPMHGKKHSAETILKMKSSHKGQVSHNKGKTLSEETKRKISDGLKDRVVSKETREKIGKAHKGMVHTEEAKRKISDGHRGEKNHNFGKPKSEETKKKISEAQKGEKGYWYGKVGPRTQRSKI